MAQEEQRCAHLMPPAMHPERREPPRQRVKSTIAAYARCRTRIVAVRGTCEHTMLAKDLRIALAYYIA